MSEPNDKLIEPYQIIERAVILYQSGDTAGAEVLIRCMEPYLNKYILLLKKGLIDLDDKEMRNFISLFVADGQMRKALVRKYQPKEARAAAYQAAGMLAHLYAKISEEDVRQDLVVCLLTMAKRYEKLKRRKVNFLGYLTNAFQYEVNRTVQGNISDPLAFRASENLSYDDEHYVVQDEDAPEDGIILDEERLWANAEVDEALGVNWLRGLTAEEPFKGLTMAERKMLKLYYVDGLNDREVAEHFGWHLNTINSRRRRLIEKIADAGYKAGWLRDDRTPDKDNSL